MLRTMQSADVRTWGDEKRERDLWKLTGLCVSEEWIHTYKDHIDLTNVDFIQGATGCYKISIRDLVVDFFDDRWFSIHNSTQEPQDDLATLLLFLPTLEAREVYLDSM